MIKELHEIQMGQKFVLWGGKEAKMKINYRGANYVVLEGIEAGAVGSLPINTKVMLF